MDVDELLEQQIGGFGRAQKKAVLFMCLTEMVVTLMFMSGTGVFTGIDPGHEWVCQQQQQLPVRVQGEVVDGDPEKVCAAFEAGTCTPKFSNDFTSIVTEVKKKKKDHRIPNCSKMSSLPLMW